MHRNKANFRSTCTCVYIHESLLSHTVSIRKDIFDPCVDAMFLRFVSLTEFVTFSVGLSPLFKYQSVSSFKARVDPVRRSHTLVV